LISQSGTTDLVQLHEHHLIPGWAAALLIIAYLVILIAGVRVVAHAATRMSRLGRIVVGLVAVWTIGGAIATFLDAYRPTGDLGGSFVEASFIVLYGLVAAGIVLAVDKTAKRFRTTSPI
jgi:hypothetical protein